uniref:Uncharacterized protein n=1 Tax=Biomphalaria glabrata TaxID=6526 RepID=A0A2C9KRA8_BIOGL
MGDCRKNSGVCERCVSGFKSPQNSCTTACEEYEFGPNCEGDCVAKCDDDCFNRVTGECSDSWISFRTLVPALIPIIIVANACIFWGYHKKNQGDAGPMEESGDPTSAALRRHAPRRQPFLDSDNPFNDGKSSLRDQLSSLRDHLSSLRDQESSLRDPESPFGSTNLD